MRRLHGIVLGIVYAAAVWRLSLFQAAAYRDAFLPRGLWRHWPYLHYLLVGQTAGLSPNAFFDPTWCDTQPDDFFRFCFRPPGGHQRSRFFDSSHYIEALGPDAVAGNAFLHFWSRGFEANRSPSPEVDMAFLRNAVGRGFDDKRRVAFDVLADGQGACLTRGALRARQDDFRATIDLRILQEPTTRRRNLVFVQAHAAYRFPQVAEDRSYDVLLNRYDGIGEPDEAAEIIIVQNGTKATAIAKLMAEHPHVLEADFVLFMDDDVECDHEDIERLFATMAKAGLDLAQPALTADSATHYDCLRRPCARAGVTYLSAVEIMAPALSRRALQRCGWSFGESISGWGVDFLLGAQVQRQCASTPALVASSVMAHRRPMDLEGGSFYSYLKRHGIDARTEAGDIAQRFAIPDTIKIVVDAANGVTDLVEREDRCGLT